MADDDSSKTEKPTPAKRKKAREDGQFARSKDAAAVGATGLVLGVLAISGQSMMSTLKNYTVACLSNLGGSPQVAVEGLVTTYATLALPAAFAAVVAGAGLGFAQAGFQPRLDLVMPKWDRLDPLPKIKNMIVPRTAGLELVFSIARVMIIAVITYLTLKGELPELAKLSRSPVAGSVSLVASVVGTLVVRATGALAVLAALDYLKSYFTTEKALMMSRQEIKEEHKRNEGDPRVKMRIRQRARDRIRKAIVKQVKTADVILANPTHVSVALRYRPNEGAPVVVAKGYDDVAMFIREIARKEGIPILESPPLARKLARTVKVGKAIPAEPYSAVAEVLAFVYRIRGRVPFS